MATDSNMLYQNYITPVVNINIYRDKEIKFDITFVDC